MISFTNNGDFSNTVNFLKESNKKIKMKNIDRYGRLGVKELEKYTPVDTGLTASSWYYTIEKNQNGFRLIFNNSNIVDNVPIAIILQYGHATKNGGWVEGIDYINPVLKPLFKKMADDIWKEVTK